LPPLGPWSPPSHETDARTKGAHRTTRDLAAAERLLGSDHPLTRIFRERQTAIDEFWAVGVAQAAGGLLWLTGHAFGMFVVIAGAAVALVAGCKIAAREASGRRVSRELIIDGLAEPSIPTVQAELRRLADPRLREHLARSLVAIADLAEGRAVHTPSPPPLFDVRVVSRVAPLLRDVAVLLRADEAAIRGLAVIERLITWGDSPLYAGEEEPLRRELGRARYLLSNR
jgi:hypothetical protein